MNNQKIKQASFLSGSVPKAILHFVWPFMLGIIVQNLYGAIDLFVVGQYATTVDVSAVTIGSQLMAIVTQLVIGLATGITVLIGRYFGANKKEELTNTTTASIIVFGIIAVFLTLIYLLFHTQMVYLMQTPPEAIQATKEYLFVCSIGILFIVGYNIITNILTGLGDSKTPFLFILVACIINIGLDILLVKYFHLGALGAAIATTIAQAGSFLFSIIYIKWKGLGFPIWNIKLLEWKQQVKKLLKIGTPISIQNVLISISFLFITAIINQFGLIASAAVGIVEKLITFLFVPAISLGTVVGTATSQNYGANNPARAKEFLWWSIGIALLPSIIIAIFCQFQGHLLTAILSNDALAQDLAANYLKSYIFDILFVSFVFCFNGYFNSLGKSAFTLFHSLITTFAVRIPLAYFLSELPNTSLYLIGWAAPISTLISLLLCLYYLRKIKTETFQ